MSAVDNAVSTVKDALWQGVSWGRIDLDVGHDDLTRISDTLAALSPSDRNAVIERLSDDNLKNWAQELYGFAGGFDKSERDALFGDLAQGLDADQFVRLVDAFENDGNGQGSGELRAAMAGPDVPAETKLAFIEAMTSRISPEATSYDPAPTHKNDVTDVLHADPDAQAVAEVLASLSGSSFDAAVSHLADNQRLDEVLQAGILQSEVHSRNGAVTNFDSTVAADIVRAAATSHDPAVQASVFQQASDVLKTIQGGGDNGAVPFELSDIGIGPGRHAGARDELANAMTDLLKSDTNALIAQLESQDRGGHALVTYLTEQIAAGRENDVASLIARVQTGDDLSGDPVARFDNVDNAESLGYFMGAVEVGIRRATEGSAAEAQAAGNLLKGVVTYGGAFFTVGGAGSTILKSGAGGVVDAAVADVVAGIEADGTTLSRELARVGYPAHADGTPVENNASEMQYDSARGRVLDENGY